MCVFVFCFLLFSSPFSFGDLEEDYEQLQDFDDDAFLADNTEIKEESKLLGWSLFRSKDSKEDLYIINFNAVPIIEYLRFISKISKINFQYEEAELNFTISVVSEEPLSIPNILSALMQMLRAHGFSLLEQDNYLMITKSHAVNQIPTIVTADMKKKGGKSPIITRIFRIHYANPTSIASIIRPMTSQDAMIDVSLETRQLIITDITTNVDKIAILLQSLDTPHSPLEIEMYQARNMPAEMLISLGKQIMQPFAEQTPLIFVPQSETNTIFIVSTPNLIERAVEIFEDLDATPGKFLEGPQGNERVFLYQIESKSGSELLNALKEIAKELQGTGTHSVKLISSIENVKWIKDSNSLLFIADAETQKKLEAILKTLDTLSDAQNYFIYKIEKAGTEQIEASLEQLAKSLKKAGTEKELIDAIYSMRYIKETNSLIFTGIDGALKKLRELLPTFDVAAAQFSPSSHFWLYTPQFLSGKELEDALEDLQKNLESAGLSDEFLLNAIESMKWVPSTNTLLFTGDPPSLERIQAMIKLIDVPSGAPTKIFIYKPAYISNEQIEEALDELADKLDTKNLSDKNLASAIDNMTWIEESQTFLFKSDPGTIEKIESFLKDLDNPKEAESIAQGYFLYKLKYARGNEVISHLEKIAKNLPEKDPTQKAIVNIIDHLSYLSDSNALLLTGPLKAVEEVKELIAQFDVPDSIPPILEKTSFFIYKPKNISPPSLQEALMNTAQDLRKSGLIDPVLLQSIETMRLVELTGSIVFTGTKESLEKTREIIATIDTPNEAETALGDFVGHTFFIYRVRYIPIAELLRLLGNVTKNLEKEDAMKNRPLIKSIDSAKEIKETNSILFTGTPATLEKIAELLKQLDVPEGLAGEEELAPQPGIYIIYKPKNVSGPELIDMMRDFETNLEQTGVRDPGLFETINGLRYIKRTGYILVSGDQSSVDKAQELLTKFDVGGVGVTSLTQLETSFLIYKLQYHLGTEIQETLKKIGDELKVANPTINQQLITAINSVQWIKITNSLLATGTPEVLTQLKELITNIDVPLRQVFIEVLILQTTLTNNQQFGLQWGSKVQYLNRFAGGTSNFPAPSTISGSTNNTLAPGLAAVNATRPPMATDIPNPANATGGSLIGGFDLGVIGDIILHKGKSFISLASLVNALQQDGDSVVVMNPKIIAQDNQQSTIFVGQNIPFAGSSVETIGVGAQQTATNIEYRDVGVSLSITPILGMNNVITMDISNEISAQVENTTNAVNGIQGLQTSRTTLNARVHVPNKHFVALSGMFQDTKSHFKSSIPCLGSLPVIGAIFSENDRFNSRDNLIFFIRPVIIDSIEEFKKITENQEDLFKDLSVKQITKEEIDDSIDWVRCPQDEDGDD